jgi:hypothetical protein
MKIELENNANALYHGVMVGNYHSFLVGKDNQYFCKEGILAVLGKSYFRKIAISRRQFAGALKISVEGRRFKSENGEYMACSDHPEIVCNFLKRKEAKKFSFWAKIVE